MMKKLSVLLLAMTMALGPSLASAQVGPPRAGQRQRLEQERRLQARFGQMIQSQLGLEAEQMLALQEVMQSFQGERQNLNRAQASLRHRLRDPALRDITDEEARGILEEMIRLREQELELYQREQEELLAFLSPSQVLKLVSLREALGQRIEELRRGGGMGLGPGSPGGGILR